MADCVIQNYTVPSLMARAMCPWCEASHRGAEAAAAVPLLQALGTPLSIHLLARSIVYSILSIYKSIYAHNTMSHRCPGCNHNFSASGFSKHLGQTHNPKCCAAHIQSLASGHNLPRDFTLPNTFSAPVPPTSTSNTGVTPEFDMDSNPILFEGDFFGSYPSSFFDDTIVCDKSTHPDPSPSDSDSSDDEDSSRNSTVWEPAPAALPTSSASAEGLLSDRPSVPASSHRNTVEEQLNQKTFVVRYPGSSTSAPIPDSELHSSPVCGSYTYQGYHSNLDPGKATNPYAPFTSRLDWELAKWAKLRGIGSTAFSDLLSIEDVSRSRMFSSQHTGLKSFMTLRSRNGSRFHTRLCASSTTSLTRSYPPHVLDFNAMRL